MWKVLCAGSAGRQLKLRNTSPSNVLPCAEEEARIWKLSRRREDSVFSPEALRPLQKAPPRKGNRQNRREIKSAVLTDTPVKDEIAAIEAGKRVKSTKKRIFADEKPEKGKAKKLNKKNNIIDDEEEEDDCFCLKPFSNSKCRMVP
nr:unnamed protein product [Callosobruchus chinensis]